MLSLEVIIETYAGMVRRIATVYERHPDRIDDLVQEVWLAIWQALPRLDNPAKLKPYIARMTQNICVTHVRRALVRKTEPLTDNVPDRATPLDEAAHREQQLARLTAAVRDLPEPLKAVAGLYLEDIAIKDIATILGISESNASVRLHRAKTFIRLRLGGTS